MCFVQMYQNLCTMMCITYNHYLCTKNMHRTYFTHLNSSMYNFGLKPWYTCSFVYTYVYVAVCLCAYVCTLCHLNKPGVIYCIHSFLCYVHKQSDIIIS